MGVLGSIIIDKLFPPEHDLSPLDPQSVYVVTGGLTGIGYHTSLKLAQRGATVFVTARTLQLAQATLAQLVADHPEVKSKIKLVDAVVDLSSFEKAREGGQAVVAAIEANGGRLDAVCLNAARLPTEGLYEIGENGFEMLVATNYLGNHIFLETLLPLLEKRAKAPGADVRIVQLGSSSQTFVPTNWKFDGTESLNQTFASSEKSINGLQADLKRYSLSKLLINPYIIELQARLDARNLPIVAMAVHPGSVATSRFLELLMPTWLIRALCLTPEHGATTSLFALTSKEIAHNPSE